nr:LapA family protein [Novosphingobium marinum]
MWIAITAILVAFIAMNWVKAPVNIWPLEDGYLHFEWPVGVIALVFFLLGFVPLWLLHRASMWRMQRRVHSLENSVRAASTPSAAPMATTEDVATEEREQGI